MFARRATASPRSRAIRGSYGGANIAVIESYVAAREDIGPDVAAAWAAEQRELAGRGEFYFACVQLCFTARRPEQEAEG